MLTTDARRCAAAGRNARRGLRSAFTLLEVILALCLAVVVLGLVTLGIHVHLGVSLKSRDQVEEAQLARVLLQRVADDLRNSVPFQAAKDTSGDASSSDPTGLSDLANAMSTSSSSSSSLSDSSSSSSSTASSDTMPLSGGIFGTAQSMQIETSRRPQATLVSMASFEDSSQPTGMSDIRTVTYSLGPPSGANMAQETTSATSGSGLYRREQERAAFLYASQNGQSEDLDPASELLAPEVVSFQISYYDGSTTSDQWDSNSSAKLPSAVRISIGLRRDVPNALIGTLDAESRPPIVYSMLVSVPNSKVDLSQADAVGQGANASGSAVPNSKVDLSPEAPTFSTPYQEDPSIVSADRLRRGPNNPSASNIGPGKGRSTGSGQGKGGPGGGGKGGGGAGKGGPGAGGGGPGKGGQGGGGKGGQGGGGKGGQGGGGKGGQGGGGGPSTGGPGGQGGRGGAGQGGAGGPSTGGQGGQGGRGAAGQGGAGGPTTGGQGGQGGRSGATTSGAQGAKGAAASGKAGP